MPDLRDMLHDAAPPVAPTFDAGDVAGRVRAADRRRRLTGAGVMAAVVVLVSLVVGTGLGSRETSLVDDPDAWPSSVPFLGTEVTVTRTPAPADLRGTVDVGLASAALAVEEDGRPALWMTCSEEVIAVREVDGSSSLPLGALVEAVSQLTTAQGCVPVAPAGTPPVRLEGAFYLTPLAAMMQEAGQVACCAGWTTPLPADQRAVSSAFEAPEGATSWGVLVDGEPLRFTADFLTWIPTRLGSPQTVALGRGSAAVSGDGNLVAFTCGMTTIQGSLAEDPIERWTAFVEPLACEPTLPEGAGGASSLATLLTDLGYEVLSSTPDPVVARARVAVEGTELVVHSGGASQVGLPSEVLQSGEFGTRAVGSFTGAGADFPAESSFSPIGGSYAVCTITHAVFAADEPGLDHARSLAEELGAHSGCDILDDMDEGVLPPAAGVSEVAQRVIAALESAGLFVDDVTPEGAGTTLNFQPLQTDPDVHPSQVWASLAGPDAPTPVVTADTEIVPLADGEGVVLPDSGMISFTCPDVGLITTSGPASGGSELASVEQLPQALGCTPRPHGLSVQIDADDGAVVSRARSIREARLARALDALDVEPCCGEPSHGGAGAATGMMWDGVPVAITAGPLIFTDPAAQPGTDVVDLAGGQADRQNADVGNPVLRFDCGDTGYELVEFLRNTPEDRVVLAAAEALVGRLGCTPSVGQS